MLSFTTIASQLVWASFLAKQMRQMKKILDPHDIPSWAFNPRSSSAYLPLPPTVSAVVGCVLTMLIRPNPSRPAVLEYLIHKGQHNGTMWGTAGKVGPVSMPFG
jgi:hypothetical protein